MTTPSPQHDQLAGTTRGPGKDSRGISLAGFLKAFPDDRACLHFLFWVRGGHRLPCRVCGLPTRWIDIRRNRMFRSACCWTTLSATRGTLFHYSQLSLWHRFYAIFLVLNLAASPSVGFLSRHLGVGSATGFTMLSMIRAQFSVMCARASASVRGQAVCVQHLRLRAMMTARGRHTVPMSILTVATATNAFAYVLPKAHPRDAARVLDTLGVHSHLYADVEPGALLPRLRGYTIEHVTPIDRTARPEVWRALANSIRFGLYLHYNVRKWRVSVRRHYLQDYLAEFVLRHNFAHDKGMLFPLFMASLDAVEYNESWPSCFGRRNLD